MKVLWTFDPFEKNKELHLFGKNILAHLFDKKDSIEAVYVASNAEVELATAFNIPVKSRYTTYPAKLIKDELKKMQMKNVKIEVLQEKSFSLTSVVKKIIDYTKKSKVDLILIATNSKEFLPRMIFGSFAETIVHMSVCDLLIFHQKTTFNLATPKNVLYAHDFSPKGTQGLERAVEYAKKWNALLTIVYVPVPEIGMELHQFKELNQKRVQKLEKAMAQDGVKCTVYTEYEVKPISETILAVAKKSRANIIALAAQSNKLEALLGGSITRQVLRETTLPTLVLKV